MEKVPITRAGYEKLKRDLEQIKRVEVPENIRAIQEARGHGDISENAEYAAAKERQSFIQGRIKELENNLAMSNVIDIGNVNGDRAVFGSCVTIHEADTGEEKEYQLVGPYESDINNGRISVTSPLGRALIGKKIGESTKVHTPKGIRVVELIEIRIPEPIS